jgi:hypothetical protein
MMAVITVTILLHLVDIVVKSRCLNLGSCNHESGMGT